MDTLLDIVKHPFVWGLGLGLLVAAFMWKSAFSAKGNLKREIKRLQEEGRDLQGHLNTQLKINSTGNDAQQKEIDELRTQNETLRVNIASLQAKPGKAEARQLQIFESAIRLMREQAPGFAPAWEQAVRRAEADYEAGEGGLKKLMRKVIPGIGTTVGNTVDAETTKVAEEEKESAK
jgi:hypothetical protein